MSGLYQRGISRLTVGLLAGGLTVSLLLRASFYFVLRNTPPTNFLILEVNGLSPPHAMYSEIYGVSLLAAIGFLVAFGILIAPRAALYTSFTLLNVCFVWTSHVLSDLSIWLDYWLQVAISTQGNYLWVTGGVVYFFPGYLAYLPTWYVVVDLECLALLGVMIASALVLNRDMGAKRAVLLAFQSAAFALVILGTELAVFDTKQWNYHLTDTQGLLYFATWFSNLDLLLCSLAALGVTTFLLSFGRLWHQRF